MNTPKQTKPSKNTVEIKNPNRKKEDPTHPVVSDPPVPNRAHTEMRTEFPPEVPNKPPKEL